MGGTLRRWWRTLWPSPDGAPGSDGVPPAPGGSGSAGGSGGTGTVEEAPRPGPGRRQYTAPPPDDDPAREAHLGAVLQALAGGALTRSALADRVGADAWGPGRLDAVVEHGVRSGVLRVEGPAGDLVRARYAD